MHRDMVVPGESLEEWGLVQETYAKNYGRMSLFI